MIRGRQTGSLLLAGVLLLSGCPKQGPTLVRPKPNPPPEAAVDAAVRVRELGRKSEQLASDVHALPGSTSEQHQKLMYQFFADLHEALPLLAGPNPTLVFRQQLATLDGARSQLAPGTSDLAVEPAIDTGLRVSAGALASISRQAYYDQADMTPLMDRLNAKLDQLDTVHGLGHSVVVTEAADMISQVVSKMADVLGQRLTVEAPSEPATTTTATAPSTQAG